MAFQCKADAANPWKSTVNSSPDADIIIDPEGGMGRFTGRHKKGSAEKHLSGRCFQEGGPLPHRIWFFVPENNHLYFGVIHAAGKRIDGTRFTFGGEGTDELLTSDEEWVATKT